MDSQTFPASRTTSDWGFYTLTWARKRRSHFPKPDISYDIRAYSKYSTLIMTDCRLLAVTRRRKSGLRRADYIEGCVYCSMGKTGLLVRTVQYSYTVNPLVVAVIAVYRRSNLGTASGHTMLAKLSAGRDACRTYANSKTNASKIR
jgi:hypothetical protein